MADEPKPEMTPDGTEEWSKKEVTDRLKDLFPEADSEDTLKQSYRDAASVLASFSPDTLNPIGGRGEPQQAMESTVQDAEQIASGKAEIRWMLTSESRRRNLRKLVETHRVEDALAANERSDDLLQQTLEAYLRGKPKRLEEQNAGELQATLQVSDWLQDVQLPAPVPKLEAVQQRLEYETILRPFRDLATGFAGRDEQLDTLSDYAGIYEASSTRESLQRTFERVLSIRTRPPLLIRAPGGMGKSTLVAQFILSHAAAQYIRRFPFAYLDFDRPGLLVEEPLTLLLEVVRQFGSQYPASAAAAELRSDWTGRIRSSSTPISTGGVSGEIGFRVQGRDWFYDSFAKFTNSIADPRWPVLLVLDTFEEVQYRSTAFVEGVFDFLDALQQRLPMLRTVLAGRAPVKLDKYSVNELKLPPFDPLAARAFLRKEFRLEGIVDDALAVIVADQVGGSPLSLKLAARLIRVSGRDQIGPEGIRNLSTGMGSTGALGDFLRDTGFLKYIVGQSVDGQLYTRILDHIHDPEVRKLAHPGLILRRITPDLILKVLAEPCGVIVPDEATAQKLFDELKKEIPLVEQTESDALIHRTDVREMMLESMKRSDEQRTREINERAIKYYAQFPDPRSRGEELYHLLLFEDFDRKRVEARVMHEALPFVLHSILELPERAQAFIAARTNTELEAKTWQKADLEDWELHAVQASRDFLSLGKFEAAAGVLHERSSRSAGSPVYAAEIEAYLAAGNLKRAASLAASYIDASFRQSDDAPLLDAALCRARVDAQTEVVQPIKEIVPVMDRLLAGPRPDPSLLSVLALYDRRYTDTGDRQIIQRWRDNLFNSKPAPSIAIADGFGLNILARLNPDSAFAKYFQQLPSFSVLQQNLASLQDVPLAEFPRKLAPIGLLFTRNTWVAWTSPVFAGSGAVSAALRVVTDGNLFDPDPFGSPINVPKGHAYLGLRVNATLAPKVGIPSEKPTFGFAAGSPVYMSHYKSFATIRVTKASAAAPTFKSALEATLQNFIIPLTPNDLSGIGVGDVAVIEGTGTFKFSGSFNLQTSVNPLVSVSSAAQPETLQIREGATIEILASCTITGDLQTRIEKVDAGTIRVGLYRKRGAEFTVQVSPSVGKTTGTTNTDFITAVLGAIGPSPFPSADELKKAGLTGKKQEEIVDALKTAIQKELELSVQAGLQGLSSQEAAFLYEISLRDLGPEGRTALQDALRLNFSKLSEPAPALPVGIREIQSLHTTTRSKGHSLKFNILGIYNFTSVSDLTLKGAVLTDPASGEVLITDRATATRVSGATNFLADSDKLRTVLAQSFLMTVAYRCSGLIAQAPSLKVSFRHFSEHAKTDRTTMQANLDVICNMGLITASQEQQSLTDAGDFGRSSFYLRTDYDDALSQGLFLRNDGQARALDEYEQIGRQALRAFLHAGDVDGYRLRSLESDAIWQQVKATGGTVGNLASLFPDLRSDTQIPVIAGDYLLIEWWATTMSKLAVTLSAAKRFFAQKPAPATNSPAFQKAQDDLWHQLAAAASSTHDRFSDPWGLMAMDLASGQQSTASARIVSPRLTLSAERAKYRSL